MLRPEVTDGTARLRKRLIREQREAMKSLQTSMAEQGVHLQAWRPGRTRGKITEKLLKLFEDEVNEDTDLDEAKGMILMAAVAWNLAVEPEIGKEMRKRLFAGLKNRRLLWSALHIEPREIVRDWPLRACRPPGSPGSCYAHRLCKAR